MRVMAELDHAPYLSALSDRGSVELTDLERAVAETMDTRGWIVLCELWGALERDQLDSLVRTRSGEAEDYASKAAWIRGLREARYAPKALAEVAERKRREATNE